MTRVAIPCSVLAILVLCSGCGHYADFTLPPADASGPSAPFHWEASPAPVIPRGAPGEWDSVDVLNPSVVSLQNAYLSLYSGYDGKLWHTGLARSMDGVSWQKAGRILSPEAWEQSIAANGSALVENGEIWYWYVGGDTPRIGLARSKDGGVTWTKQPEPVVPLGPPGSFDERAVADPFVLRRGDELYLYYLGQDRARRQRLGVARSHDGMVWEKLRGNPILELGAAGAFDEGGLGEPAVWSSGGSYWLLYTGRARDEQRRVGLARSSDGTHWERDSTFEPIAGLEGWNSKVICDPSAELTREGTVRVWFGGGNVPRPDQNLNGQIGMGILRGTLH